MTDQTDDSENGGPKSPSSDPENQEGMAKVHPIRRGNQNRRPDLPSDPLTLPPDDEEAEVFVRRREKRLAQNPPRDYPWLRRVLGLVIIAAALFLGWKMLDRKSGEIERYRADRALKEKSEAATLAAAGIAPPASPTPAAAVTLSTIKTPPEDSTYLSSMTVATISECTQGANAFRLLDLDAAKTVSGKATLEGVFKPVLQENSGAVTRAVSLQNIVIQTKSGEEWRLHATHQSENSGLKIQLFRADKDGLPEEFSPPAELQDLPQKLLNDETVARFLAFSNRPGEAKDVERHESWSYPDKAGIQVTWLNSQITDMQVYMAEKFLACNRGTGGGVSKINCECMNKSARGK